jgi:hypothetical protein
VKGSDAGLIAVAFEQLSPARGVWPGEPTEPLDDAVVNTREFAAIKSMRTKATKADKIE